MKKWMKFSLAGVIVAILAVLVAVSDIKSKEYTPSAEAARVARQGTQTTRDYTYFKGDVDKTAVVFYPGALVAPDSYSIWAAQLARQGHSVYLMHFPMDLAVLAGNRATAVPKSIRQNYVIGGHSLGGVIASRYAAKYQTKGLKGVFFLASYPDEKGRLDTSGLPVLSVTGSRDGECLVVHRTQDRMSHLHPLGNRVVLVRQDHHAHGLARHIGHVRAKPTGGAGFVQQCVGVRRLRWGQPIDRIRLHGHFCRIAV